MEAIVCWREIDILKLFVKYGGNIFTKNQGKSLIEFAREEFRDSMEYNEGVEDEWIEIMDYIKQITKASVTIGRFMKNYV